MARMDMHLAGPIALQVNAEARATFYKAHVAAMRKWLADNVKSSAYIPVRQVALQEALDEFNRQFPVDAHA